ncbi:MAG: roadblock/LC7 domain-containing protein [Candidatus Odinarchaeota archaeon]
MEPTSEYLNDILKKLLQAVPEVEGAAIMSTEGLPIASVVPQGVDKTRIAAMAAALFSTAEKAVIEMEKGEFVQLYIKGSNGYLLLLQAGPNAVLMVSTTKDVRLGLIFLDAKKTGRGGDGDFPFPYIQIPPSPPGDLGLVAQPHAKESITKQDLDYELYCKHCGTKLPEGQMICHVCGKRVG